MGRYGVGRDGVGRDGVIEGRAHVDESLPCFPAGRRDLCALFFRFVWLRISVAGDLGTRSDASVHVLSGESPPHFFGSHIIANISGPHSRHQNCHQRAAASRIFESLS